MQIQGLQWQKQPQSITQHHDSDGNSQVQVHCLTRTQHEFAGYWFPWTLKVLLLQLIRQADDTQSGCSAAKSMRYSRPSYIPNLAQFCVNRAAANGGLKPRTW